MATRDPGKKKGKRQSPEMKKSRLTLWIAILLAAGLISLGVWVFVPGTNTQGTSTPEADDQTAKSGNAAADKQQAFANLVGRWKRTDGGYVIDIRRIDADGNMEAGYFNPRPINVSRAEAAWSGGGVEVFIELQVQGYPGSTYTLTYDRPRAVLAGVYFQAVMGQEFEVVFARME